MAQKESELEEMKEKVISKAITMYKKVVDGEIKQLVRECVLLNLCPTSFWWAEKSSLELMKRSM